MVVSTNNIYLGGVDFTSNGTQQSCLVYTECSGMKFSQDHDLVFGVKNQASVCTSAGNTLCIDPMLVSSNPATFDGRLAAGSPARDSGVDVGGDVPAVDIDKKPRPAGAGVDRGAFEQ